ncbi:HEPN domain-containing protein [Botrimarina hoheduenensis]|uniref:HEPN domain-containing protein n=1 Tax=Botrimarina hoheduenensis TaxID=2528000 RepID=A0A5C5W8Y4_9BACT|nr:HEPN domain-containing protein [Botrimarina hoheduenensis]TWT47346.1 hypothetical protein Pla111_09590 [Botrimarina hoheduenensis]
MNNSPSHDELSPSRKIYNWANSFDQANRAVAELDYSLMTGRKCELKWEKPAIFPGIVLAAFASELYLKAAITFEGNKPPRTHRLRELFDALSENAQAVIQLCYLDLVTRSAPVIRVEQIEASPRLGFMQKELADFYSHLDRISDNFAKWRYGYESMPSSDGWSSTEKFMDACRVGYLNIEAGLDLGV